ncbi:UNVERIFIED_CONTAM: hypothetical protein Slati_2821300 [Sesamum latifolium]|uniref:Uncharacterized protein n=1 Tax=Sesamum latifolium TaxID=2727402 RepID=A0AAW2VDZ9_9LAMI
MAPSRAEDNFSVEVSDDVLRRGGSVTGTTTLGGDGVYTKAAGVDPPPVEVGGISITTCKV